MQKLFIPLILILMFVFILSCSNSNNPSQPSTNPTATPTDTISNGSLTNTNTPTETPTGTWYSPTATFTETLQSSTTTTETNTPTNTPLATNTPTDTPLATNTSTDTPLATNTPTDTPFATNTPTNTPTDIIIDDFEDQDFSDNLISPGPNPWGVFSDGNSSSGVYDDLAPTMGPNGNGYALGVTLYVMPDANDGVSYYGYAGVSNTVIGPLDVSPYKYFGFYVSYTNDDQLTIPLVFKVKFYSSNNDEGEVEYNIQSQTTWEYISIDLTTISILSGTLQSLLKNLTRIEWMIYASTDSNPGFNGDTVGFFIDKPKFRTY